MALYKSTLFTNEISNIIENIVEVSKYPEIIFLRNVTIGMSAMMLAEFIAQFFLILFDRKEPGYSKLKICK